MASQHQVKIKSPDDIFLTEPDDLLGLSYAWKINEVSACVLKLQMEYEPYCLPFGRIEIWRRPDGGAWRLEFDTIWIIQKITRHLDSDGQEYIEALAYSANWLLKTRHIMYFSGTSQASKSATYADNILKAFVRENLSSTANDYTGAGTARRLSSALFSVQGNLSQAATVSKAAAWKNLLTVCQEVCDDSTQLGTYLCFDVVAISNGPQTTLELRTFVGQRGIDHRSPGGNPPLVLDPQLGNLGEITQADDYSNCVTYQYVGGQGEGAARQMATPASNATLIGLSPFGRIESFQDARNSGTLAGLNSEARAQLWASRPVFTFDATILETPYCRYGLHWYAGDIVTAKYRNRTFDCRVDAVQVSRQSNMSPEEIQVKIQSVN